MVGFETRDGFAIPTGAAKQSDNLKPENFKFWSARAAPMTPFASLSASILGGLGKPGTAGGRVEPATGYEFPAELCYLKKPCPSLAGLGVRNKRIVIKDIHVYALGIYVDAAAAKSALAGFKKKSPAELEADQSFYDAVVSTPSVEKSLRLVISSRLVDRKKFLDALEDRLAPRLKQAGEPSTLDNFRAQFDSVHFEKGLEIAFTCVDNKKLVTKVAGQEKGSIASPALCSSLFDIYLGTDPVSKDAKTSFGKSLAAALKE
ncbi:hypothetical protein HXX76_015921 [Chlamydomonas incerta]|uniref:Chalcone-flavonone isomerase family protein n=1 Tax=Chlamydomonas incerta TaxID=51695 RepID=A0A835VR91_CHLIN|nr:hypothetical protein HXX76_015921 [Chlamydomonas incerta]|eukprot:KAG2422594.1 hypothetical protein HXX76_015921 [Chlamydomonas incerta]